MVEIKIHKYLFTVELCTFPLKTSEVYHGVHEPGMCGETLMCHNKIYINDDLAPEVMKWTISHELTHAYLWAYGFDQYEGMTHEQICEFVAGYGDLISNDAEFVYKQLKQELKTRKVPKLCLSNVG